MRKTFTVALAVALAGGLAAAGAAAGPEPPGDAGRAVRATDVYRGAFKQMGHRTRIIIKVRTRDGAAKSIRALRYRRLPATCEKSGDQLVNDGWRFTGFRVNRRRRFSIAGEVEDGSTIAFSGRFSKSFGRVRGRFQSRVEFTDPAPKTCETMSAAYGAKRLG
jgi:hypothetical protein